MNPQAFSAIFGTPPGMASPETAGVPAATPGAVTPGFPGGFSQLLHVQNATAAVMEQLRVVLPVEEFAQLEAQVDGGNLLPLAEIVAALGGQQQALNGDVAAMEGQPPLAQIVAMMRKEQGAEQPAQAATEAIVSPQESPQAPLQELPPVAVVIPPTIDQPQLDDSPKPATNDAESVDTPITEPLATGRPEGVLAVAQASLTGIPEQGQEPAQIRPFIPPQAIKAMLHGGKPDASPPVEINTQADSEHPADIDVNIEAIRQKISLEGMKPAEAPAGHGLQTTAALGMLRRALGAPDGAGLNASGLVSPGPNVSLQTPQASATVSVPTSPLPIDLPPGHKGWNQAIGERMMWMIGNRVQAAEVRITPPHLGPIDIRISIQNDQTSVSFVAQHAVVREALEASIPRLREMLGESNLQLANVDVGQRDANEQRGSANFFQNAFNSGYGEAEGFDELESGQLENSAQYYRSDGLLDAFA